MKRLTMLVLIGVSSLKGLAIDVAELEKYRCREDKDRVSIAAQFVRSAESSSRFRKIVSRLSLPVFIEEGLESMDVTLAEDLKSQSLRGFSSFACDDPGCLSTLLLEVRVEYDSKSRRYTLKYTYDGVVYSDGDEKDRKIASSGQLVCVKK